MFHILRNSSRFDVGDGFVLLGGAHTYLDFSRQPTKETHMSWKTPHVIEVAVGMEINCYACAEI